MAKMLYGFPILPIVHGTADEMLNSSKSCAIIHAKQSDLMQTLHADPIVLCDFMLGIA